GNDFRKRTFGGDVVFKYKGLALFSEAFFSKRLPEEGAEFETVGVNAEAGFFVVGRKVELAARYAQIDPNRDVSDDRRSEIGGALNYFYNKHSLKWVLDVRRLEDRAKPDGQQKSVEVRSQLQFTF